jgi:hypothetical protein
MAVVIAKPLDRCTDDLHRRGTSGITSSSQLQCSAVVKVSPPVEAGLVSNFGLIFSSDSFQTSKKEHTMQDKVSGDASGEREGGWARWWGEENTSACYARDMTRFRPPAFLSGNLLLEAH